jgi:tetratricopeptide (TPR) repeat protein
LLRLLRFLRLFPGCSTIRFMDQHLRRANLLIEQGRHELAESFLGRAIAEQPNEPTAHALMALCLLRRERFREALAEARQAIHCGPDEPLGHYVCALVIAADERWETRERFVIPLAPGRADRQRLRLAEQSIREAIHLSPGMSAFHSLLARILAGQDRLREALAAAERALVMDANDTEAMNLRSTLLRALGRADEAGQTALHALRLDPTDAESHEARGWSLLHAGQMEQAASHFREELRLDPTAEGAKNGFWQAIRSRNAVYRLGVRANVWIETMPAGQRFALGAAVVIGAGMLGVLGKVAPILPVMFMLGLVVIGVGACVWVMLK